MLTTTYHYVKILIMSKSYDSGESPNPSRKGDDFYGIVSGSGVFDKGDILSELRDAEKACPAKCSGCPTQSGAIIRIAEMKQARNLTAESALKASGEEEFMRKLEDAIAHSLTMGHPLVESTPIGTFVIEIEEGETAESLRKKLFAYIDKKLTEVDDEIQRLEAIQRKASAACLGLRPVGRDDVPDVTDAQTGEVRTFARLTCTAAKNSWGDEKTPDSNIRSVITKVIQ